MIFRSRAYYAVAMRRHADYLVCPIVRQLVTGCKNGAFKSRRYLSHECRFFRPLIIIKVPAALYLLVRTCVRVSPGAFLLCLGRSDDCATLRSLQALNWCGSASKPGPRAALPEEQHSAIMLVCVSGLSYAEAAAELDIPVGTLMSRLCRGRLELARRMKLPASLASLVEPE